MTKTPKFAMTGLVLSTVLSTAAYAGNAAHAPSLLPQNPEAGECYARVMYPAQYRTETETVMVEAGYADLEVTHPQIRSRQEQILVKEASLRYEVKQPTYRSVSESVLVRPAFDKLEVTPPQFSVVTETVQVSKPRLVWKKGNPVHLRAQGYKIHSTADAGVGGRGYSSTTDYGNARPDGQLCETVCEVWCLVEEPGQTVTFNRKDLVAPSQVKRVSVPAKYTQVTKQVVADPGGVREIPIPAEYRSITVEDVVGQADVRKVKRPAKYGDVAKKVLVSAERYEWRRVVCAPGTHPNPRVNAGQSVRPHSQYAPAQYAPVQSALLQTSVSQTHPNYSQNSGGYSASQYAFPQDPMQPRVYGGNTAHNYATGSAYSTQAGGTAHTAYTQSYSQVPLQSGTDAYKDNLPTYSEDYSKPAQPVEKRYKHRSRTR